MSKNTVTPEGALNGLNLGLSMSGYHHVFERLKTWPTDQLAAVLLEALLQRNRLLKEKNERTKTKKEGKDKE